MLLDGYSREEVRRVLCRFADRIERVSVFGSRATGRARVNSDIDLVVYGQLSQGDLDRLWTDFEESRVPVSVDLVRYTEGLSPLLKDHIDRFALPLFTHDDFLTAQQTPQAA